MSAAKSLLERNRISNVPLREPMIKSKLTYSEVARELGKVDNTTGKMNTTGLQRMLGLRDSPPSFKASRKYPRGKLYEASFTKTIDIDVAKAICRILGEDFDELYAEEWPEQKPAAHCKTCDEPMMKRVPSGQCGFCEAELEEFGRVDVLVAA